VKNNAVQFLLALFTLIFGGALEESLPKVAGVGFPVLLAAVLFFAPRRCAGEATAFAVAAGALEDALCGLPAATSSSFFLAAAALARWPVFPRGAFVVFYPAYHLWLTLWIDGAAAGMFTRLLAAVPVGWAATAGVARLLALLQRKAAVDDA
jgi:hypothetical protein